MSRKDKLKANAEASQMSGMDALKRGILNLQRQMNPEQTRGPAVDYTADDVPYESSSATIEAIRNQMGKEAVSGLAQKAAQRSMDVQPAMKREEPALYQGQALTPEQIQNLMGHSEEDLADDEEARMLRRKLLERQ